MKKSFLLFSLFSLIFSLGITFGYSAEDLSNANSLADQNVIVKQIVASKYNLDSKILRQEVIGMALKIKGITLPENYKCKKYYSDVPTNDWVCRAVELAADNGIITRSNKYTNPGKYVTRAEAFAMIYNASGINPLREVGGYNVLDKDAVSWQRDLINRIYDTDLSTPGEKNTYNDGPGMSGYYYPNRLATRAEVFEFAKNIITTQTGNCAKVGEKTSSVYTEYPEKCCSGLTNWSSGMDTSISIGAECYETGNMAGNPTNTCIACGDGTCSNLETPCNCPQDCENGENADYATITDFCESVGAGGSDPWGCREIDLPLCHLCQ